MLTQAGGYTTEHPYPPSTAIMMGDTEIHDWSERSQHYQLTTHQTTGGVGILHARHNNMVNLFFADGHASAGGPSILAAGYVKYYHDQAGGLKDTGI